ncbi:uncharacterized protein LOC116289359, partial [Actinia tenebrosa]|uniref:Uncharacterized protein LOC116289359 n=1 Tax=Actinia tenebrosa TaxID=6105 RepID=A0A6P8HHM4_ACTTE
KLALREKFRYFTEVHKPKEDISSVNEDSSDESSYCKINDAYENQSDVEHKYEERPIKSNIGSPNCVGDVENSFKVSSGLFNKGLEEDEDKTAEKPSDDQDENEKDSASDSDEDQCSLVVNTNEDQPTFNDEQGSPPSPLSTYNEAKENEKDSASDSDEDQCSLVVNASVSPSLSFSSDFDVKFKPIGIENPNEYQPTFNEKQGSSPLCTYNEAEDNPLPFDNPFLIEEEENDLNKPCSKLNDDNNDTIGTPPSTPSSFDFGLPLNVWSTDSQKSSPSLPKKDPEEDKDSDDTANGSSSSNKDKESGINLDNSESESAQPDPNTDAHVEDSELNENDDVCESGSDVSSENSEKFMEYDLLDIDVEELEKEGENNVAFKRFKKRDSFTI